MDLPDRQNFITSFGNNRLYSSLTSSFQLLIRLIHTSLIFHYYNPKNIVTFPELNTFGAKLIHTCALDCFVLPGSESQSTNLASTGHEEGRLGTR